MEIRMSKNIEQGSQTQTSGFKETIWRPLTKLSTVIFFLFLVLIGGFLSTYFLNIPILTGYHVRKIKIPNETTLGPIRATNTTQKCPQQNTKIPKTSTNGMGVQLNCTAYDRTRTCSSNHTTTHNSKQYSNCSSESSTCPEYFRWIYEDLKPWSQTGISRKMIKKAKERAHFKLIIVNGKAYVDRYDRAYQTRDLFTWWGVLQLLRRYPGKVPDLELVFNCHDRPVMLSRDHFHAKAKDPPTLFGYCGDDDTLDLIFPDWSFWGWPELNIKPWEPFFKELEEGNKRKKWVDREPYAYWKGNTAVSRSRRDLLKCNVTKKRDWNARLYLQDWVHESQEGYKNSNMADQCTHRYKIYIEGNGWSVSEKYILSCDSLALLVNPRFYDFFSRGLKPMKHYWPIKANDKCRSIKKAVDWGNTHQEEAQAIGKAALGFMKEELKMDYVYDYMFHLLNEYSKLLNFKPTIPQNAFELCLETMYCPAIELEKKYMMDTMVKGPADTNPCTMPPPFESSSFYSVFQTKADSLFKTRMVMFVFMLICFSFLVKRYMNDK